MTQDRYREEDHQEYIVEDSCVVEDHSKYLRIDWYAVDPDPLNPYFETSEFGPCPKQVIVFGGTFYVRTDFSTISKS